MDNKRLYEKWMWTELLGFDNYTVDFSVKEFLDNAGFVPHALSLHLFSPDFIHLHQGIKREITFPPDFCSYIKSYNSIRKRQAWTNYQLKGLITELHKYGIQVYCSFFSWTERYPELLETKKTGEKNNSICPLLRFKGNIYYEDFFIQKLTAVMKDYGFDGFHAADGYSSNRLPLYESDYSDDMVDQFVQTTGVKFPLGIRKQCGTQKETLSKRADWIWQNKRCEWINFYADRWEKFFRKVVTALHKQEKKVVVNNAWTKEPFQALYRYGVDYKKIAVAGIDAFIPETVSTATATDFKEPTETNFLYDSLATVLLMKAYTPQVPMIGLNGTRDIQEQWDNLAHAPTALEREIYSLSNLYHYDSRGKLSHCFNGPLFCLADDVRSYEWQWLQKKWDLGFSFNPKRIIGTTLVWSDRAFEQQLPDFIETRRWTTHRIVYELMSRGAPIYTVVNVNDLSRLAGADLLVTNPHLYPKEELKSILSYKEGTIIMIGGRTPGLPKPDFQFEDIYQPNQMFCGVYGRTKKKFDVKIKKEEGEKIPGDMKKIAEPQEKMSRAYILSWFKELYFRKVSNSFLEACTRVISGYTSPIRVLKGEPSIKTFAVEGEAGILRFFVGNDSFRNIWAEVEIDKEVESVKVVTEFPCVPIVPVGSKFTVHVPTRGIVIVDVKEKRWDG